MVILESIASKPLVAVGTCFLGTKAVMNAKDIPIIANGYSSIQESLPVVGLPNWVPQISTSATPVLTAIVAQMMPQEMSEIGKKSSFVLIEILDKTLQGAEIIGSQILSLFSIDKTHDEEGNPITGFPYVIPVGMSVLAAVDIYMGAVLLRSLPLVIDVPLKKWVLAGLVLSFPSSALVDRVARTKSFRAGFLTETALCAASLGWLAHGTQLVSNSDLAITNAPLLWWSCYTLCILAWSVIGTIIFFMIVTTVLSVMFGDKRPEL